MKIILTERAPTTHPKNEKGKVLILWVKRVQNHHHNFQLTLTTWDAQEELNTKEAAPTRHTLATDIYKVLHKV